MLNPKLEILVTDSHIKFMISCRAHNDNKEDNVDLKWVYCNFRHCLTDILGTLGEDYGEKVLPGLRRVAWNILSDPTKYPGQTKYTLNLYFSFPEGSLKFKDYCSLIKLFTPGASVPEDPNLFCMKKTYLWRLVLTAPADDFLKYSLAAIIRPTLAFILALPVPSPVFAAAMSGTEVAAPDTLVASPAAAAAAADVAAADVAATDIAADVAATDVAADDTEHDEKYPVTPKTPAAAAQTFFKQPKVALSPIDEDRPFMPMGCNPTKS